MRKVPHRDLLLLINVRQKRPPIVDAEIENAVLIWRLEGDTKNGCVCRLGEG